MPDSAKAAGLQYSSTDDPGIRRIRVGSGFRYVDSDGAPVRDPEELRRIKALVIPPAWTDVWICPKANGHLQATGRDAKGRKQYRYHRRYRRHRDETKFDRMLAFSKVLPKIRGRVERDLGREGLPRDKVLATVVRLLEKTLIRIGSDVYARENRSYGLTTMKRRHVEVSGSKLRFEFRGKSGVSQEVAVSDRRAAQIVQHCQTLPGQELFQYLDEDGKRQSVDSGDINSYLREITGQEITAKDFRTFAGTVYAALALRDMGPPASEREANANIVNAIDKVAARLGNTRAVCRHYYVHPGVLEAYKAGRVAPAPPPPGDTKRRRKRPGLRQDEIAVLELLHLTNGVTTERVKARRSATRTAHNGA